MLLPKLQMHCSSWKLQIHRVCNAPPRSAPIHRTRIRQIQKHQLCSRARHASAINHIIRNTRTHLQRGPAERSSSSSSNRTALRHRQICNVLLFTIRDNLARCHCRCVYNTHIILYTSICESVCCAPATETRVPGVGAKCCQRSQTEHRATVWLFGKLDTHSSQRARDYAIVWGENAIRGACEREPVLNGTLLHIPPIQNVNTNMSMNI